MGSFGILNTNVGLTTNVKIMVDSNYKLSLDSIESNDRLSLDRYKKFSFNKKNFYDEIIPTFYKETPSELAYYIKYDNDVDVMSNEFKDQYSELYSYGAKNITNNKSYKEEYEYFAPLYIDVNKLPDSFIIFRVDGPGLGILNKDNFKTEILKKFKTIKLFNLKKETPIGEWLDLNFVSNDSFPPAPLEVDFRSLEFTKWNGIDFSNGGYSSKSFFMDDIWETEREIFELEKTFFDNYKNNGLVFPNILNLSFLFDDNPSTPDFKRKWSINRYYGFYLDELKLSKILTPYKVPELRSDVIIKEGNILHSPSDPNNPFIEKWSDEKPYYVEYNGDFYLVEKFTETRGISIQQVFDENGNSIEEYSDVILNSYKIIADIDLEGKENDLNNNYIFIENNKLFDKNNDPYVIDDFENADVWIIEINGIYHNIIKDENDILTIFSDYLIKSNKDSYEYRVSSKSTIINTLVDFQKEPKVFKIFKLNFLDIKDFDNRIIDTEYSRFEYEKKEDITDTDETKMYVENLLSNDNPKSLDDFVYKEEVVNIPVSSEYTANYETFKIKNGDLSDIWRINPVYCKWGYQYSNSQNDKPYLLNNSLVFEDFNRTANVIASSPLRSERNLDYFYSINSSTSSYVNHSLHVEEVNSGEIDLNYQFDLDKYLNIATYSVGTQSATYSFNYFKYFFERKAHFSKSEMLKNVRKYSKFNKGDNVIPNMTVFKGLEFRIYDVDSIILDDNNQIENTNLKNSDEFNYYDFSILLSNNNLGNSLDWTITHYWEMDKEYQTDDIVLFDDIMYIANTQSLTEQPTQLVNGVNIKSAPFNLNEWDFYINTYSPFWSPLNNYSEGDYVYNNGEYYQSIGTASEDFWNTQIAMGASGYGVGDVVLYKGNYYFSMTSSNHYTIDSLVGTEFDLGVNWRRPINRLFTPWVATQSSDPKWLPIEMWNPSIVYNQDDLVIHNNILWSSNQNIDVGQEPGISSFWERNYSLEPDFNYIYQPNDNPVIDLNNRYYICNGNITNSKLDNGINIYINKKWKNILVNINVSDNTLPNLLNSDRDLLYQDLYYKLTANNFSQAINDLSNRYGFSNYLKYIVIDKKNNITEHSYIDNITNLKYILNVEYPDSVDVKINSLIKKPITSVNSLNSNKVLNNFKINNLDQLNWYNNLPIAVDIQENEFDIKPVKNFHRLTNITSNTLFRFSGYYMPVFYDIELFKKAEDFEEIGNWKFDTSLSDFGLLKERKIRKTNRKDSILKLKNVEEERSIYPMLDEFGYSVKDFFIFKSNWDYEYHIEINDFTERIDNNVVNTGVDINQFGKPSLIQNNNLNI